MKKHYDQKNYDPDNYKTIGFHDCFIDNIFVKDNKMFLYLMMDVHWYPGKKYGIFTLENFSDISELVNIWGNMSYVYITRIDFTKKKNKHVIKIILTLDKNNTQKIECSSIVFKRQEEDYRRTINEKGWKKFIDTYFKKIE